MEWLDIIKSVGVPIACMVALALYVLKRDERDEKKDAAHAAQIADLMEMHKTEIAEITNLNGAKMEKLTDAVNNNTLAMTKLCERIGKGDV